MALSRTNDAPNNQFISPAHTLLWRFLWRLLLMAALFFAALRCWCQIAIPVRREFASVHRRHAGLSLFIKLNWSFWKERKKKIYLQIKLINFEASLALWELCAERCAESGVSRFVCQIEKKKKFNRIVCTIQRNSLPSASRRRFPRRPEPQCVCRPVGIQIGGPVSRPR